MGQELAQGQPWRNLKETSGKVTLESAKPVPSHPSQQTPPSELFLPEQRQKLLNHLVQVQFPAVRELVARVLEGGYFLLDPADVTLRVIRRMVVEADEFSENSPYWDWVRSVASVTIHEIVVAVEESGEESDCENRLESGESLRNQLMRKCFNRLPMEQRRALYHVAVLGQTLEDAARSTGEDPEQLRTFARDGLREVLEGIESEERGENHV